MTDPLTVRVRVFQSDSLARLRLRPTRHVAARTKSDTFAPSLATQAELGDAMSKMRLWLAGEKIQLAMFKTGVDARGYTLDVGFRTIDDAERFRAQFPAPDSGP